MNATLRSYQHYASAVFTREKMAQYLNKEAYKKIIDVIEQNASMTPELADQVAHAMKEWAFDNNATHFTHWFQPMRGATAEKHDAFLTLDDGVAMERFSGSQLIQSEPDASSFPSGGMRSTFEARGYTAWDPSSPVFLARGSKRATLVIPSVYISWNGEVLDLKTPVLRSNAVVEAMAMKVLKKFGNRTARRVKVTVGPEQEYFLISLRHLERRKDLLLTGRTLLGAPSAKHQQFEDHYFGAIRPNVIAYMEDVDDALAERGIPFKTRHNEVAPHQYELAPTFVDSNLAVDQNLQLMDVMQRVAEKHGLTVLFADKPFSGINGSGKHLNWSMADSNGHNLFEPGDAPKRNIQFLVFLSAMLIGVDKFSGLLRASVADAGNDHRLGANEAPPAIMSVYIGGYIEALLKAIEEQKDIVDLEKETFDIKVKHLPGIALDSTDRNRTSPVAFTGNKFEFRAVGSDQNIAEALTALNLIVAYGLEKMLDKIDKFGADLPSIKEAALAAVGEALRETKRVRFDGNNYDPAWHAEAVRRGLPNAKNTPEALHTYLEKDVVELYEKYGVLKHKEVEAKVEVRRETYKKVKILELEVLQEICRTSVLPAVAAQIARYGDAEKVMPAGRGKAALQAKIGHLADLLWQIDEGVKKAAKVAEEAEHNPSLEAAVEFLGDTGAAALAAVRAVCDQAECHVEDELWKLPKYWEMLHIH
jgi:glutamine synthetase